MSNPGGQKVSTRKMKMDSKEAKHIRAIAKAQSVFSALIENPGRVPISEVKHALALVQSVTSTSSRENREVIASRVTQHLMAAVEDEHAKQAADINLATEAKKISDAKGKRGRDQMAREARKQKLAAQLAAQGICFPQRDAPGPVPKGPPVNPTGNATWSDSYNSVGWRPFVQEDHESTKSISFAPKGTRVGVVSYGGTDTLDIIYSGTVTHRYTSGKVDVQYDHPAEGGHVWREKRVSSLRIVDVGRMPAEETISKNRQLKRRALSTKAGGRRARAQPLVETPAAPAPLKPRGGDVENGTQLLTGIERVAAVKRLLSAKARAKGNASRGWPKDSVQNLENDEVDALRKRGHKVSVSSLRKWAHEYMTLKRDAGGVAPKTLRHTQGRPPSLGFEASFRYVQDKMKECSSVGSLVTEPFTEKTLKTDLLALQATEHESRGLAPTAFKKMSETTLRRTVKRIETVLEPAGKSKERSDERQRQNTSVRNAAAECCTASLCQEIKGHPDQHVAKQLVTNLDPFVVEYGHTKGKHSVALRVAERKGDRTSSVQKAVGTGARVGLTHNIKIVTPLFASGSHGIIHLIFKLPTTARAGLSGEAAKPLIAKIPNFGITLKEARLVAIFPSDVQNTDDDVDDSPTERLWREVILKAWLKDIAAEQEKLRQFPPPRHDPSIRDDDSAWLQVAASMDSHAPPVKAMAKLLATTEGKELNICARQIGANYTGPAQSTDAGDVICAVKRIVRKAEHDDRGSKTQTKIHFGVRAAVLDISTQLKVRHVAAGHGHIGTGALKELSQVVTQLLPALEQGLQPKHVRVGFVRTGEVGDSGSHFAVPSAKQFLRQVVSTGGHKEFTLDAEKQWCDGVDLLKVVMVHGGGRLKEADHLAAGMPEDPLLKEGEPPRETMAPFRQRSYIINPADVLEPRIKYHEGRLQTAAAVVAGDAARLVAVQAREVARSAAKAMAKCVATAKRTKKRNDASVARSDAEVTRKLLLAAQRDNALAKKLLKKEEKVRHLHHVFPPRLTSSSLLTHPTIRPNAPAPIIDCRRRSASIKRSRRSPAIGSSCSSSSCS